MLNRKFFSLFRMFQLFFVFLFSAFMASSQRGTIQGIVKAADGHVLAGASVLIQGARTGAIADSKGKYTLSLSAGKHMLTVSFVGFDSQRMEITIASGQTHQQDFILKEAADLANISVIGSRNLSRTRVETPVPVDIIPVSQVVNNIGQVDVNQILTFIAPSFQSARQTIADGTDHVDPAQLRGLGSDQVLVLINGKRRHQSALVNVNGTVNRGQVGIDMSTIPAAAIDRIEILRDGAAVQYGSDAL